MMRWIVGSSLKLRRLVVAAAAGVMIFGIVQVGNTPVDVLPEFNPPMVEVQTEALGLSAAEVEQLITVPLEQDLLVGVPFLDEIESVSLPGLSSVVMTFQPGTELLEARQVVQERLTQAVGIAGLPAVAKLPQMIQPLSSSSRVSMVKLTSAELTPIEMSVLARWVISPRLLGVPGVANVAIWGNRDRQLQVLVDPERLQQNDVTLDQVIRTAGNSLEVSPLSFLEASTPGTGGFIDMTNQRLNIFHEQAISTPSDLAQVPIEGRNGERVGTGAGGPASLGDVTDVVEDHQPLIGDAACSGGEDCLLLVVEKFPGANTVEVSEELESALGALRQGLADMQMDSSIYRPASYLDSSFMNLGWALLAGVILLLLLIVAFFWDWRRSVIVVAAMTVSVAGAVLVLNARGTTVDLMVVTGLVLGLTAVIDDAVTDVDGLALRMRQHREKHSGAPVWATIVDASTGIRRSILYAILILAAATLPLFFLQGEGGAFLPPIALSYLLAVAASMVVALTVTPVLSMMLLSKAPLQRRQSPMVGWLRRRYDGIAPRLVTRTGLAFAVLAGFALVGVAAAPFLETSLRPALQERDVLVRVQAAPGTSLTRMTGFAAQAVDELGSEPGVLEVTAQIGRAVMSDQVNDVNRGEIWVKVDAEADYDETVASIEDTVGRYPGITTEVTTYSEKRVGDVLQQGTDDIVVRIYGENAEVLETKADEVRAAINGVDGATRVNVEPTPQESTFEVQVDLDRAQELGIKPGDVRRAAASLLGGITVGNLFEEQKVFDVVVWGAPEIRETQADVQQLLIDTPDGRRIRLGDVAEVQRVENAAVIRHESAARYVDVTADVSGRDTGDVTTEVNTVVEGIAFPLDHHAEVLGGFAERQIDQTRLITVALAAALAIFLLLQAAFRSWRLAALAFVVLPVTLAGGVVATLLFGGTITLGSIGGLMAVLGIASRGVILLIRHLQHLERREGMAFGPELVVRGTGDRIAPTLMSALALVAILVPIAFLGARSGFEVLHPAVITILGGVVTATVVNLFVVPLVYLRFGSVSDTDSWADDLMETVPETAGARLGDR